MRTFKEFLTEKKKARIHRFKLDPAIWEQEYQAAQFSKDVSKLLRYFKGKFKPNEKLLATLTSEAEIEKEQNKLKHIIWEAFEKSPWDFPAGKLWSITKTLANNGKDPALSFVGNADQRWNNIFKKLGYL